jgi:hypothetical protein
MKAAMRSTKESIGSYGAASAIFSGVVACAFVIGASIFGQDLASLVTDLICDVSPDCSAPAAAGAAAVPVEPTEQVTAEIPRLEEPPASTMPTNAMQPPR